MLSAMNLLQEPLPRPPVTLTARTCGRASGVWGGREKERRDYWSGSFKSVFLPKERVRLWVPMAGMPCFSLRLEGGAKPRKLTGGQLAAFPLDPAKMDFLVGQGQGTQQRTVSSQPQVSSLSGNIVPKEAGSRMCTYFVAVRFQKVSKKEGQA